MGWTGTRRNAVSDCTSMESDEAAARGAARAEDGKPDTLSSSQPGVSALQRAARIPVIPGSSGSSSVGWADSGLAVEQQPPEQQHPWLGSPTTHPQSRTATTGSSSSGLAGFRVEMGIPVIPTPCPRREPATSRRNSQEYGRKRRCMPGETVQVRFGQPVWL